MPRWWYTTNRPCPYVFLRAAKLQLFSIPPNKIKEKNEKYGIKGIMHGNIAVSAVREPNEQREPSSLIEWQSRECPCCSTPAVAG